MTPLKSATEAKDDRHTAQIDNRRTSRRYARGLLTELHSATLTERRREDLRDQLVRLHMPLVHHVARRIAHRSDQLADVVQVGALGLVNAIDRFDPSRGIEFSTYAVPTISGEIKR